jgi:hypothetical protein
MLRASSLRDSRLLFRNRYRCRVDNESQNPKTPAKLMEL